ncbi:hypothetical protein K450DRAFT_232957 [Umbelopsis ramanniana AG]|uniref:Uncharacterized protein n=1 Tax=Umbelopsis ramanniana AG TaxID=1314678 RepID=A0AAD5ECH0_UMBRA|nr:uncharacterized protein K450DRAFT_232957 [Umbelopsis ramanniana AG]KAI8581413.1 hypothetical protein K450DRAFT_232957 [Umbelopsis ramanniana AG]
MFSAFFFSFTPFFQQPCYDFSNPIQCRPTYLPKPYNYLQSLDLLLHLSSMLAYYTAIQWTHSSCIVYFTYYNTCFVFLLGHLYLLCGKHTRAFEKRVIMTGKAIEPAPNGLLKFFYVPDDSHCLQ